MSRCDVTAGHYYGQLMTAAHASCSWPAAAPFSEHGQHARHRSLLLFLQARLEARETYHVSPSGRRGKLDEGRIPCVSFSVTVV